MSEPQRFRTRAAAIEAIPFDGDNHNEIIAFTFGCFDTIDPADCEDDPEAIAQVFYQRYGIWIPVKAGMWVARDDYGYYPIRAEKLAEKYEPADDPEPRIYTFTWGQSVDLDRATGGIDIPFNDGKTWAGSIDVPIAEAQVLYDMLGGVLKEAGGGDE